MLCPLVLAMGAMLACAPTSTQETSQSQPPAAPAPISDTRQVDDLRTRTTGEDWYRFLQQYASDDFH